MPPTLKFGLVIILWAGVRLWKDMHKLLFSARDWEKVLTGLPARRWSNGSPTHRKHMQQKLERKTKLKGDKSLKMTKKSQLKRKAPNVTWQRKTRALYAVIIRSTTTSWEDGNWKQVSSLLSAEQEAKQTSTQTHLKHLKWGSFEELSCDSSSLPPHSLLPSRELALTSAGRFHPRLTPASR